jgi:hypothetical protein
VVLGEAEVNEGTVPCVAKGHRSGYVRLSERHSCVDYYRLSLEVECPPGQVGVARHHEYDLPPGNEP